MSMTRAKKTSLIDLMSGEMAKAPNAFVIDYKGIKVVDVTELRRQVKASGSEYIVVKNTLALRAVKDAPLSSLSDHFSGMTAVAYSQKDVVALAKVLHTFGKTNPHVKVKAALVEGKPVPATSLEQLATMPSRNELVAKLLGLMQSPMRRLVGALSGPQRNVAAVLAAIAKTKEEAAPAA